MVAKKLLAPGDTILCEKPIVSSQFTWNRLYRYRVSARSALEHVMTLE